MHTQTHVYKMSVVAMHAQCFRMFRMRAVRVRTSPSVMNSVGVQECRCGNWERAGAVDVDATALRRIFEPRRGTRM